VNKIAVTLADVIEAGLEHLGSTLWRSFAH
jgi:hypothetical protein